MKTAVKVMYPPLGLHSLLTLILDKWTLQFNSNEPLVTVVMSAKVVCGASRSWASAVDAHRLTHLRVMATATRNANIWRGGTACNLNDGQLHRMAAPTPALRFLSAVYVVWGAGWMSADMQWRSAPGRSTSVSEFNNTKS